mmetsp:Transcript_45309/g.142026  ORF Transcript_45309/g.142026 Transcript_45309/m.142026 type:complete len:207 (-) Transcript_45309:1115-1735(-)
MLLSSASSRSAAAMSASRSGWKNGDRPLDSPLLGALSKAAPRLWMAMAPIWHMCGEGLPRSCLRLSTSCGSASGWMAKGWYMHMRPMVHAVESFTSGCSFGFCSRVMSTGVAPWMYVPSPSGDTPSMMDPKAMTAASRARQSWFWMLPVMKGMMKLMMSSATVLLTSRRHVEPAMARFQVPSSASSSCWVRQCVSSGTSSLSACLV